MNETLLQAYGETDYLVCLDAATWTCIRINQRLPESLQLEVGTRSWGFITAWNPHSKAGTSADNHAAQRALLVALQALPESVILSAIGIGNSGWHEPSLFVIGPDQSTLDALAHRHQQNAYVYGQGSETAHLRVLSP